MASLLYILIVVIINKYCQCKVELTGFEKARAGEKYTLTCEIYATDSETKYNWYRNNELVAVTDSSPNGLDCKILNISQSSRYELNCKKHYLIIKSVDQIQDNDVQWRCKPFHHSTEEFPEYASNFTVKTVSKPFKPIPVKSVSISLNHKIDRIPSNITQIQNGEDLLIDCKPNNDASPAPNIRLYMGKPRSELLLNTTGHHLKTSLNVTMEMDGFKLYCKANNSGPIKRSRIIKLQVLDSPTMSLHVNNVTDNKIILQCEVDGRPNNYTFSPWKHYLDGVLIREVKGYLENGDHYINYLKISTQLFNNRGVYVCSGSYSGNGQMYTHTANRTITSTASVEFYENDLETMTETVRVGFDYNISKIFITGSNSNITWFKDNSSLELSSRIDIRRLEVYVPHDYNQSVFIAYSQTLITITPLQVSDEGWYNCLICNHDDCSNSSFHLLVEDEDPVKDGEKDSLNNTKRGASPNNESHDISVFIGAGGAAGLFIIIIIIIIIIVVVTRSRRKSKETVPDDQPHREMEIMENDLYISGDTPTPQQNNVEVLYTPINKQSKGKAPPSKPEMEIMENHLYISADYDASQNQTDGNGVTTKPEMEILENDLYISADYDAAHT